MRRCISHHDACDCREEMMREICKCFLFLAGGEERLKAAVLVVDVLYPGLKREIEMELEEMRNES